MPSSEFAAACDFQCVDAIAEDRVLLPLKPARTLIRVADPDFSMIEQDLAFFQRECGTRFTSVFAGNPAAHPEGRVRRIRVKAADQDDRAAPLQKELESLAAQSFP